MIRLGIIGAGAAVRELHWPVLRELSSQIEVVAVANRTVESARAFAKRIGDVRVCACYHELLSDPEIDAVLIAVPIEFNAKVLIDAVRAGKHALAEKPIAATRREALQVLRVCSKSHRSVAIAENFRYRGDLRRARELIQENRIGGVFAFQLQVCFDLDASKRNVWTQAAWRRSPRHPGGFLLDAGIHAVAGLRDVLGEVSELSALTRDIHPHIQGPDSLLMQVTLKSGAAGHFFACYTAKVDSESLFDLRVYGTEGSLQVSDGVVRLHTKSGSETEYREPDFDRGYRAQWLNFLRSIQQHEPCQSTPQQACLDLLVIDAALRSARLKTRIRLR
jgi:predicted dehydrogenase